MLPHVTTIFKKKTVHIYLFYTFLYMYICIEINREKW